MVTRFKSLKFALGHPTVAFGFLQVIEVMTYHDVFQVFFISLNKALPWLE
jgi:hypothetical protein